MSSYTRGLGSLAREAGLTRLGSTNQRKLNAKHRQEAATKSNARFTAWWSELD